jgi:hyperosmotically inducible protein
MKTKLLMTCVLASTLIGPAIVTAADDPDSDRANPATFVKDSAITAQIKTKLAAEHFGSLAKIHVDTDQNGAVWLSGTAESQAAIDRAVAIAKATEHVYAVHSTLTVKKDD